MKIPVIFENDDFVVVNKPIGLAVQDEANNRGILPLLQTQLNIPKLWLVHRLDKVTSGLLMLAKNADSASRLSQYFAQRQMQKYYLALSNNKPKKKQGAVVGDMRKIRDGKWALSTSKSNPAIGQFFSCSVEANTRLFVIRPHTGKTHQLRVMLKSLSSPILGDVMYTGTKADRTYLHAYGLQFEDDGYFHRFTCMPQQGNLFQCATWQQQHPEFFSPWDLSWPKVPSIGQSRDCGK